MSSDNHVHRIVQLVFVISLTNAANILYLNGATSPSHHIWNKALADELAARGHNLTIISPDEEKNSPTNTHYIHIEGLYSDMYFEAVKDLFTFRKNLNPLLGPSEFCEYFFKVCKATLQTRGFRTLLEYPSDFHFDLIINDYLVGGCLLGFVHKFNYPPLLSVTAFSHPPYTVALIGGHHYYSYVPHYNLFYQDDMNFIQRIYNFAVHLVELYTWEYVFNKKLDQLVEGGFGPGMPSISELEKRTAIAFVNTNPAFDYPAPLPENVIPVGGLHIQDPKPLPKDLEEFIVSGKMGTILFSLGTNARSSFMDVQKQNAFIDAFELFPDYHFLWKFEELTIDLKLPNNVIIRPWLPQTDILAHPNVTAFLTHSGLLSTHEAIWRGVPMIGIPIAYDQHKQLMISEGKGIAEKIDFDTMTTETIKEQLNRVLKDPKYTENIKKLSAKFRDQKEKPLDRAVWWAEWLIRNPDCEYLKSPVLKLGFISGNSYDVIALISIILFVVLLTVIKLGVLVLCKLCKYKFKSHESLMNGHKKVE